MSRGQPGHVLSHAAIYLVARGLPGIVAFLAIPLFTRLLNPADYGKYFLVVAAAGLINALLFQWLRLSLVRYLPGATAGEDAQRLKSTLLTTTVLLVGGLGLLAAVLCVTPGLGAWRSVVAACWILLAAQAVFEMASEYARAALAPWRYMALHLARSGAMIGLGALLVLAGMNWWGPLLGTAAGMALGVAIVSRGDWRDARLTMHAAELRKLARYGVPLSLTVGLTIVIMTADRFLIDFFLGKHATGLYAVAVDFTMQTLLVLMVAISMAVFPVAIRAFEREGQAAAQEQMRWNAVLLLAVGLPCVVGLTVLAPGIANVFFGPSYRAAAAQIVPLVALGAFLNGFKAFHFDAAFQFAHRTIQQVWIVLFAAAFCIALNLLLIPRWGIRGAAVATVATYVVSIGITAVVGRRHFVLPWPARESVIIAIAAGVMALALYPLRGHVGAAAVVAQIAGGAAVYGAALVAMNFLNARDRLWRRWSEPAAPQTETRNIVAVEPSLAEVR